jgi:hypothetical protein
MTADEARNNGIDEMDRRSYLRVDRTKGNTVPPARVATWRQFENVSLPNGDEVGVIVPCTVGEGAPSTEREAATQKARDIYLALLDRFTQEGRTVGDRTGKSYAPSLFAMEPEAKIAKVGKVWFEEAQRRLFADRVIRVEPYGKPSHHTTRIVRS